MIGIHRIGFGALLLVGCLTGGCTGESARRPNIILITLDTTRADRLGFNGYARETSPNLDRLAAESVVYTRAYATASSTLPSHASLFTGKFTASHGAWQDPAGPLRLLDAIPGPEKWEVYRARGLQPDQTTLATLLADQGYRTGAVVAGPWLKRVFGFDRGFELFDDAGIDSVNGRLAEQVTASAVAWLEAHRSERFFLFLNYFDPHAPYDPPEEFLRALLSHSGLPVPSTELQETSARYDAEILYMDHHIGVLLRKLEEWALHDDAWILVTSDHGELLGEHGKRGHGNYLFQEEIRVPLISKLPGGASAGTRVDLPLQLIDVLPMICDSLGLPLPPDIQGSIPPEITHPIVAEIYPHPTWTPDGQWRALIEGDFKFHWNSLGGHRLYDLRIDPLESLDLFERRPELAARMDARLNGYLAGLPKAGDDGPPVEVDEETLEALKGLGYLQ